ncbi:MAG: von Willebrand factor type [Firmicutes bacterium]|nr:von Willebrand factor type [Bacillota bacterium]
MNKRRSAIIFVLIFLISLCPFIGYGSAAAENGDYTSKVDVVFVVDASKSMKASDPEGLTAEAMKMFIDLCHINGDKGGMVAYSGYIKGEAPLNYMNSEADKTALKNTLTNLELGDWTDIGLGLYRGVTILREGHDADHKPIIILLSDGKNDPQRDKTASQDDLAAAINEAKAQNFPVYTIGLNADGTVDENQLKLISSETNGKNFITNNANDLPQILREIYAESSRLKVAQQNTITGNGDFQEVAINIPDSNNVEANITLLSANPVELKLTDAEGNEVSIPSEKAVYSKSSKYSMLKLVSPAKGEWTLSVKGNSGERIDISLISNYDFKTVMGINPETNIYKGDKVAVSAYIESNGQKLEDEEFYDTLKAVLYFKNLETGGVQEIEMARSGNGFVADVAIPDEKSYTLTAKIEGTGFTRESAAKNIGAVNRVPAVLKKNSSITLWTKNAKNMDLSKYFSDEDNDKLTYTVSSSSLDAVNIKIADNVMEMQGRKWGASTVTVTADDGKGGRAVSEIKVNVWFLTTILPAGLGALFVLLAAGLLLKRKRDRDNMAPAGQMLVSIRDEETGAESEPEYLDLGDFKGTFSVFALLKSNPIYAETGKILLKAKDEETLVLTNSSQCKVESDGVELEASKEHIVKLNDTIRITTPGGKQVISMKYCWRSLVMVDSLFKDGI